MTVFTSKEDITNLLEKYKEQLKNAVEVEHSWIIEEFNGKEYRADSYVIYSALDEDQ